MKVVVGHRSPAERARMRAALQALDAETTVGDDALAAVRAVRPDVAVVDDPALIGEIASDPDLLGTSVVLVGGATTIDAALEAIGQGAHDVLPEAPGDGELVARVRAAARTGALRAELLARDTAMERVAFNDELTGLWNRRFLARRLSAAITAAGRRRRALSVAIVDLDHFTEVNDRHGHAAGDAVLVAVGGRLRSAVREEDVAGRWGGEEFLVILPDEPAEGAASAAARIREVVAAEPIAAGEAIVHVTVSVGCATWRPGEGAETLLRRADRVLEEARAARRGAVSRAGA